MAVRSKSGGVASRIWALYNASLDSRPLLTKSLTSVSGFIIGDTLAQVYAGAGRQGGQPFDFARTARFAIYGFCIHAPSCHYFYQALDKVLLSFLLMVAWSSMYSVR